MANVDIFARAFAFATRILAVAAGADALQLRRHGHDPGQDAKLRRGDQGRTGTVAQVTRRFRGVRGGGA